MAYVSHSAFDQRPIRDRAFHPSVSLSLRTACVAIAAAGTILALSEVGRTTAPVTATKSDRSASPAAVVDAWGGQVTVDVALRTSTAARGAVATPFSPEGPMAAAAK